MKHSAYRSMKIAKEGKTKNRDGNLRRWINEDWRNLTPYAEGLVNSIKDTPECGKPHPEQKSKSVCRPLKKVSNQTPELATSYSKDEIKKAVEIKNNGETIKWSNLKGGNFIGGQNYNNLSSLGYPLGDDDIKRVLPDAKIIDYEGLKKYSTIDELLPNNKDYVIILYENEQNSGHWVCVIRDGNTIEFFCSYGTYPDHQLKWVDYNTRKELGSDIPLLSHLFDNSPYEVIYNEIPYQSENKDIATCGKHCVFRIRQFLNGLNLQQYQNLIKKTKPKKMSYDEFINNFYDK